MALAALARLERAMVEGLQVLSLQSLLSAQRDRTREVEAQDEALRRTVSSSPSRRFSM